MCTTIASILIHSVYLKGYPVFLGQNLPWSSETNNGWQVYMLPQDCPSITPHALVSHPPELASPHPAVWRPASTCFTAAHKNTKGNAIQYLSSSSISHLHSRSAMQYDTSTCPPSTCNHHQMSSSTASSHNADLQRHTHSSSISDALLNSALCRPLVTPSSTCLFP